MLTKLSNIWLNFFSKRLPLWHDISLSLMSGEFHHSSHGSYLPIYILIIHSLTKKIVVNFIFIAVIVIMWSYFLSTLSLLFCFTSTRFFSSASFFLLLFKKYILKKTFSFHQMLLTPRVLFIFAKFRTYIYTFFYINIIYLFIHEP